MVDDVLAQMRDALQALDELLAAEHDCLLHARIDALTALTERKTALLGQVAALEQQRTALLRQDATAAGSALWTQVQALAKRVVEANSRNGAMIQALLRNTEGALHVLLQTLRGSADQPGLYGAHGQGQSGSAAGRWQVSA